MYVELSFGVLYKVKYTLHKLVLHQNLERRCHKLCIDCLDFEPMLLQACCRAWHIHHDRELCNRTMVPQWDM